jgi:hypothetical protein
LSSRESKKQKEEERGQGLPPKLIVRNLPWSIKEPEDLFLGLPGGSSGDTTSNLLVNLTLTRLGIVNANESRMRRAL